MTIEDEAGCANVVIFPNLFEEFRKRNFAIKPVYDRRKAAS